MTAIGLVLSAGGVTGTAFHAAVLDTIATRTGWDPRTADVIVGTSAGAIAAGSLRAGLSAADHLARVLDEPLSESGAELVDRIQTPYHATDSGPDSMFPAHLGLVVRGLTSGFRPVVSGAGLFPRGANDNNDLGARVDELQGRTVWPEQPTWICALRTTDGKRVVFGRDDHDPVALGTAVRASAAVPGRFAPVEIHGDEYIDGGVHSTTNADLVAALSLDAVIVSSSMSAVDPTWFDAPARAWHHRTLHNELRTITRYGTPVFAIEPDADVIAAQGSSNMSNSRSADVAVAARAATERALTRVDSMLLDVLRESR